MKVTLLSALALILGSFLSAASIAVDPPFLPVVVLIVDETGLPLRDVAVRIEDPGGAKPIQDPDQIEKLWMERIAQPVRSDDRGAAILFYRGRVRKTITNADPVYARPIYGTIVVESPGFQRVERSLGDLFGRTATQPPIWAPFLKVILKREPAGK